MTENMILSLSDIILLGALTAMQFNNDRIIEKRIRKTTNNQVFSKAIVALTKLKIICR